MSGACSYGPPFFPRVGRGEIRRRERNPRYEEPPERLCFSSRSPVRSRDRTDGKTAGFGRDYLVGIFRDKSIFYLNGNCGEDAGMKRDFWGYPQYTQELSTKEGFMELECRSMKRAALRGIRFALVDCPGAVRPAFKLLSFASSSAGSFWVLCKPGKVAGEKRPRRSRPK